MPRTKAKATSRRPGAYAERWKRVAAPRESQGISAAVMRERDWRNLFIASADDALRDAGR